MNSEKAERRQRFASALSEHEITGYTLRNKRDEEVRQLQRALRSWRQGVQAPTDVHYRHVAAYILIRSFEGATQKAIAGELAVLGVEYTFKQVGNFLRKALALEADGKYNTLLLKPGKPGPKGEFKHHLEKQLAKLSYEDVVPWRFWTIEELTFLLQTGMCPPSRHGVVQREKEHVHLTRKSNNPKPVALLRVCECFSEKWYEVAVDVFQKRGRLPEPQQNDLAVFEAALADYVGPEKRRSGGLIKIDLISPVPKGPSPRYLHRVLNELGYHRTPFVFDDDGTPVRGFAAPSEWKKTLGAFREIRASDEQ